MEEVKVIGRDPFARHDIIRQAMPVVATGCSWCGNLSPKGKLYRYGIEPDAIRVRQSWSSGLFCCKSCWKNYSY